MYAARGPSGGRRARPLSLMSSGNVHSLAQTFRGEICAIRSDHRVQLRMQADGAKLHVGVSAVAARKVAPHPFPIQHLPQPDLIPGRKRGPPPNAVESPRPLDAESLYAGGGGYGLNRRSALIRMFDGRSEPRP